ncbi:MAG: RluA family pseudouridine synthase [Ruminococcus sp.]|nr:RluA family pseudouridine synthase [Ruminococcus sp.]
MYNILIFTVPKEYDGAICKEFLKKYCKISSRLITKLVRTEKGITKDGKLIRTIDSVHFGDKIEIKLPNDNNEIEPVSGELDIKFEDKHILIVNKPPNMPVHPTKNHQRDTLANIVRYYALSKGEDYTFRAINRIDRDTSGLVLIAKDRFTASGLKSVYKEYTAVCQGNIVEDGTVDKNIRLRPDSKMVREVNSEGARAVTHYFVLSRNKEYSLVRCILETGRTHQIRCHMSYLGHPLAGDDLYGGNRDKISRQALHCSYLRFIHPVTKQTIEIKSQMPDDMKSLIKY